MNYLLIYIIIYIVTYYYCRMLLKSINKQSGLPIWTMRDARFQLVMSIFGPLTIVACTLFFMVKYIDNDDNKEPPKWL